MLRFALSGRKGSAKDPAKTKSSQEKQDALENRSHARAPHSNPFPHQTNHRPQPWRSRQWPATWARTRRPSKWTSGWVEGLSWGGKRVGGGGSSIIIIDPLDPSLAGPCKRSPDSHASTYTYTPTETRWCSCIAPSPRSCPVCSPSMMRTWPLLRYVRADGRARVGWGEVDFLVCGVLCPLRERKD